MHRRTLLKAFALSASVVAMGMSFGDKQRGAKDTDVHNAKVYINNPIVELPDNVVDLTEAVRGNLQAAVDRANLLAQGIDIDEI